MSEQNNICKHIDCFPTPKILIRSLNLILAIGNLFGHVVACSRCSDRGDHTKGCEQKQEAIIGSWQKKKKKKTARGYCTIRTPETDQFFYVSKTAK